MSKLLKKRLTRLVPAILMTFLSVPASATAIDEAVKRYYAGFPDEAISMLKPLALSGDADAQYLLGNITYSLSTVKYFHTEDPLKWYRMSAEQNSAPANYALGVIYYNRWLKSRDNKEAASAVIYYQKAADLGYREAQGPLEKVISQSGISQKQAVALVKIQPTKPVTRPDSMAQKTPPTKPVTGPDSMVQKTPPTKPVSGTVSTVQKAPPITPVFGTDSRLQQVKSEPVAEPVKALVSLKQKVPIALQEDDEPASTVTLAEIASQCQNFTQTGFDLYAVTIKGALFTGTAVLVAKRPESKSGTYLINLTSDKSNTVLLDLHDVPGEIASRFGKGDKFGVTGIVIDSKVVGSGCTLKLKYESANS